MAVRTLSELLFQVREVAAGRPDLLAVRRGSRRETLSTTDFLRHVHSLALALEERGVAKGDRVAIYSESRPEWHVVDFACQLLGAPTVPVDPASTRRQVGYVLRNSASRWVFYSDPPKRDVLLELESAFTTPLQVAAFDGEAIIPGGASIVHLMGEGAERLGEVPVERFRGRVEEEDLATVLYTLGTAGDLEAVPLNHRQLVAGFRALGERLALGSSDVAVSFLPLADGLQRTLDHLCFDRGTAIRYLPESEDLFPPLGDERPTLLAGSPRLFERARARILDDVRRQHAFRRRLFDWALAAGRRRAAGLRPGAAGPFRHLERRLADFLVLRRVRGRFGGRLRYAVAAAGPLDPETGVFFTALGVRFGLKNQAA